MGLGCAGKCGMVFLIVLNTIFLLLGLGLMIAGILMITNIGILDSADVEKLLNNVQLNSTLSLGTIVQNLPKLIIAVGAFIFVLAVLGGCGACCKSKVLLVVYAILVLLILIVQIVGIALFVAMKDTAESKAKEALTTQFNKYNGPRATDSNSKSWNLLFVGFKCCGVEAVTTTNNGFDQTAWYAVRGADQIPYSCCKEATEDNYSTGSSTTCTTTIQNYHTEGCFQKFLDWLTQYQVPAIAVSATLLVIELLAVVFSFVICKSVGKDEIV